MITQELLGYIRSELSKGKSREDIHSILMSNGGWSEDDLSEAFRTAIPMQGIVTPKDKPMGASKPISVFSPAPAPAASPAPLLSPSAPATPSFSAKPSPMSFSNFSTFSPKPAPTPAPAPAPAPTPAPASTPAPAPMRTAPTPAPSVSPSPLSSMAPSMIKPTMMSKPAPILNTHHTSSFLKFLIILIIVAGLGYGGWYYRSSILNLFKSLSTPPPTPVSVVPENPVAVNTPVAPAPTPAPAPAPVVPVVKDCGATSAPKLGVASSYANNPVLACLGESAASCSDAKGILNDAFFPPTLEIIKSSTSCNFKLSYPADSTLVDVTGVPLALQYISCPIDVVKMIDNSKPATPKFLAPIKTDLAKYGSDIYLYGTLGLFVQNNLDQIKIMSLGCTGPYIQSVIASYNQKKTP